MRTASAPARRRLFSLPLALLLLVPAVVLAGSANLKLVHSSAQVVQTSDTEWLLEKVGALNGNSVSWVIGATELQTVEGQLRVQGHLTITNSGSGPATIGNIVVNLQTRAGNKWVTRSTDIANATDGDDATTANIHKQASSEGLASFTENGASGSLQFMDATNNTVFSLVPQVLIPAGGSRALLFQASFDNNVLNIAAGTAIRSETIVSFGNATVAGNSTANVDINGNGTIDADEARIRSVPSRITVAVPAAIPGNGTVTLSDTLADIVATGDVTFSNAIFNLGATSGTVTASVDGGANGGTITNCAHLTGASSTVGSGGFVFPVVNGVDLEACDTVAINGGGTGCTPGAPGCGWNTGDVVTYIQAAWGATTANSATNALNSSFATLYGSFFEIGIPGSTGFSILFTSASRLNLYLPAGGTAASLNTDLLDPTTTAAGALAGEVAALKLNVDLNDNALLGSTASTTFGDLRICGVTTTGQTAANGQTVRQLLASANTALGGGATGGFTYTDLAALLVDLNAAFPGGTVSSFAQDHVVAGACP